MQTFNLEKALKGDLVVTKEGDKVEQLKLFQVDNPLCLVGVVDKKGMGTWDKKGKHPMFSDYDLFMKQKIKKLYVAINKNNFGSNSYSTTNAYEDKMQLMNDLNRTNDLNNFYIKEFDIEN